MVGCGSGIDSCPISRARDDDSVLFGRLLGASLLPGKLKNSTLPLKNHSILGSTKLNLKTIITSNFIALEKESINFDLECITHSLWIQWDKIGFENKNILNEH